MHRAAKRMQQTTFKTVHARWHECSVSDGHRVLAVSLFSESITHRPQPAGSLQVHDGLVPAVGFHVFGHRGRLPENRGWYLQSRRVI